MRENEKEQKKKKEREGVKERQRGREWKALTVHVISNSDFVNPLHV